MAKLWRKRVGSKAVGKAQPSPGSGNCAAHQVGIQRPTPGPEEQRPVALDRPRALACIVFDRLTDGGNDGHDTGLRSLADNPQRLSDRPGAAGQRKSLCNAEAGAVEQQQDGEIPRTDPRLGCRLGRRLRPKQPLRPAPRAAAGSAAGEAPGSAAFARPAPPARQRTPGSCERRRAHGRPRMVPDPRDDARPGKRAGLANSKRSSAPAPIGFASVRAQEMR